MWIFLGNHLLQAKHMHFLLTQCFLDFAKFKVGFNGGMPVHYVWKKILPSLAIQPKILPIIFLPPHPPSIHWSDIYSDYHFEQRCASNFLYWSSIFLHIRFLVKPIYKANLVFVRCVRSNFTHGLERKESFETTKKRCKVDSYWFVFECSCYPQDDFRSLLLSLA